MSINKRLYDKQALKNDQFSIKPEALETIIDSIKWDGDSEFYPGFKSRNWHEPDEPGEVSLNVDGILDTNMLTHLYGEISEEDIENIKNELENSDELKDQIKEIMDDIKASQINSFTFCTKISSNKKTIKISADANDFEFYEREDYEDY